MHGVLHSILQRWGRAGDAAELIIAGAGVIVVAEGTAKRREPGRCK